MASSIIDLQPIMSLMHVMSRVPPNPFNPFPFGMTHIPQPVPSIRSGYTPSSSYPIHSMPAHLGFGGFGDPLPQCGGYILNRSLNHVVSTCQGVMS